MSYLDIEALRSAPLSHDPYDYLVVPNFVRPEVADAIGRDYPKIDKAGSFTLDDVQVSGALAELIEQLDGPEFRTAIEDKFDLDLGHLPTMFTVRGMCGAHDGQIHTDSKTKVITVLLYLNEAWAQDGGRLRLLRNGEDLEAVAAEVPPDFGTLLVFRRSENSWHGHKPFAGPRRVVQMNWVTSDRVAAWQQFRHRVSAAVKRLTPSRAGA
ncbi:MAG: 2OG-Fe(II) oxygenase [Caulobacteraceae bacterium]|nr:2OG-Fe(II) oxygenase [Caulobacteraceae bacterium]